MTARNAIDTDREEWRSFFTPHVPANDGHKAGSKLDGCATRHAGQQASQRPRTRVEAVFGWDKDGRWPE